jgi:hypothetical protein
MGCITTRARWPDWPHKRYRLTMKQIDYVADGESVTVVVPAIAMVWQWPFDRCAGVSKIFQDEQWGGQSRAIRHMEDAQCYD